MQANKALWDNRIESLRAQVFKLYWEKGVLTLSALNQFKELLNQLQKAVDDLYLTYLGFFSFHSKDKFSKEEAQIDNLTSTLEYNLRVIERLRMA